MTVLNNISGITSGICDKKARQAVQRQPIFIADAYHGYILDEIERCDHIDYEGKIHNDDK